MKKWFLGSLKMISNYTHITRMTRVMNHLRDRIAYLGIFNFLISETPPPAHHKHVNSAIRQNPRKSNTKHILYYTPRLHVAKRSKNKVELGKYTILTYGHDPQTSKRHWVQNRCRAC